MANTRARESCRPVNLFLSRSSLEATNSNSPKTNLENQPPYLFRADFAPRVIFFLNIRYLIQRSYLASYNMCSRVPTDPGYEIVPRAPRSAGGPGGHQGIFSMYIIMMYMLESCCSPMGFPTRPWCHGNAKATKSP